MNTQQLHILGKTIGRQTIMASNNNHPITVEDITKKMKLCASDLSTKTSDSSWSPGASTSRDSSPLKKSRLKKSRKQSLSVSTERKKHKNYYLFPIGSVQHNLGPQKTLPKWIDVASIIEQGVFTHRNLDSRTPARREPHTTLNVGTLSSMLVKQKLYAVTAVVQPMPNLQLLLDINAKRRIFEETHAKFVCINLMMALRFLHAHGIFHGSICPRKVVFNERYYPCLTGFGTAEIIDDRQSRPRERTQLEYTSPEQLWTEHLTELTDIFSTACLTYAMIYGKPPHQGAEPAATRRNIQDPGFCPSFQQEKISPAGKRLIMRCIRKSRRKRYSILTAGDSLTENITWFNGLCEDRIYKQTLPSPLAGIIKQHQ